MQNPVISHPTQIKYHLSPNKKGTKWWKGMFIMEDGLWICKAYWSSGRALVLIVQRFGFNSGFGSCFQQWLSATINNNFNKFCATAPPPPLIFYPVPHHKMTFSQLLETPKITLNHNLMAMLTRTIAAREWLLLSSGGVVVIQLRTHEFVQKTKHHHTAVGAQIWYWDYIKPRYIFGSPCRGKLLTLSSKENKEK